MIKNYRLPNLINCTSGKEVTCQNQNLFYTMDPLMQMENFTWDTLLTK
jgi:hypothetical protein